MAGAPPPLLLALLGLAALAAAGGANAAGRKTVGVYELRKGDFSVRVTNWGATLTSVVLPDSRGAVALRAHAFLSFYSFQESMASVRPPVLCCAVISHFAPGFCVRCCVSTA
jgi:aldose 1-epimerase